MINQDMRPNQKPQKGLFLLEMEARGLFNLYKPV